METYKILADSELISSNDNTLTNLKLVKRTWPDLDHMWIIPEDGEIIGEDKKIIKVFQNDIVLRLYKKRSTNPKLIIIPNAISTDWINHIKIREEEQNGCDIKS